MTTPPRRRVLVLYGGRSSEHEVSCLSARSVLAAVDRDRYEVVTVGITRDGRWTLTEGDIVTQPGDPLPTVTDDGPTVALVRGRKGTTLVRFDDEGGVTDLGGVDVCFPVLHGPFGEDGTVQGLLETMQVPYVGADVTASSVGIDKRAMKNVFKARGLPQVAYLPVRRARFAADPGAVVDEIEGALSYPLFTKPARQGSSIGIAKAVDAASLRAGITEALGFDEVVIVEEAVEDPRELEVGALGNDDVSITAPGEIKPSHEFYDFDAKYLDDSELIIPAEIPLALADRIDAIAREAYVGIGCRGLARIDFFLSGDGELVLNEINTIPGFTPNSMYAKLWQAEGVDYPQLVDRLLSLALESAR